MAFNKKTLIVVGSITAIGFLGDVLMYSLAASQGGPFRVHFPKGKALFNVLWLGIVTGLITDMAVNKIVASAKSNEEQKLDKLVAAETERIQKGDVKGKEPQKVLWV